MRHATAGLEWEWMPRSSLVVTYLHASGRHLPRLVERNVGPLLTLTVPVAGTGGSVEVPRLGPGPAVTLRRVIVLESSATSTFHGVQLELRRALHQGVRYRLAYAWSRARDTGPTPVFAPESPRDRFVASGVPGTRLSAPADDDQPHRFLADVVFFTDSFAAARPGPVRVLLDHWRIAAVYSLQSGRPFSAYVAADLDGDGNAFNDIAPGTTRNGFRAAKEGRLDARLAREFRLGGVLITPSVDLFNAFNAFHGREVDDVLYGLADGVLVPNPAFGERYTPRDNRTLQLGVSIGF